MIADTIAIFKARKDPALAAKLGARLASGVAIEKIGWPLVIAKLWMALAGLIASALLCALFYSSYKISWGFLVPALLPTALIYGIYRIWSGMNTGLERVKLAAEGVTDKQIDIFAEKIKPADRKPPH